MIKINNSEEITENRDPKEEIMFQVYMWSG